MCRVRNFRNKSFRKDGIKAWARLTMSMSTSASSCHCFVHFKLSVFFIPQERKVHRENFFRVTFAPMELSFLRSGQVLGTLLGTVDLDERKLPGNESSTEWKLSLWTFRFRERKCSGTKSPSFHFNIPKLSVTYKSAWNNYKASKLPKILLLYI